MKETRFQHLPRGPQRYQGETVSRGGRKRKSLKFLFGGILVGLILISPYQAQAKGLSYREPQIEDGIPQDIKTYCELVGDEFHICPELLEAVAYYESRFIPEVKNKNCYGLLQVNVKIHADRINKYDWTAEDMLDPYKNITVAADYLAELYETYGDENPIVLSIYSGNKDAVEKYKKYGYIIPYVNKVMTKSAEYERLHQK